MKIKILVIMILSSTILLSDDFTNYSYKSRVQNGSIVESDETYPWISALFYFDETTQSDSQFCAGALIAPEWILTAGHCVELNPLHDEVDEIEVEIGSVDLTSNNMRRYDISEIIIHPDYNDVTGVFYAYDIALLHLDSASTIQHLPLIFNSSLSDSGETAIIMGWGDHPVPPPRDSLLEASMTIHNEQWVDDFMPVTVFG